MDRIEQRILQLIESHSKDIIEVGRDVYRNAELGYKEHRTSALIREKLESLGIVCGENLAVTGFKGYLKPKDAGSPVLAVIGEMDGLPISNHICANPETGASHCCGHNAQIAALIGAAIALSDPQVKEALGGNIVFMAVPAEEYVDMEFRMELQKKGVICYGGGKSELIRIGAFDDVDLAVGHHTVCNTNGYLLANGTTNGFVNKTVHFYGKAAHAADRPHEGINALNAAQLMLHAIDLQRETFRDQDAVRIHSILTEAGTATNVITERACVESSVRAKRIDALRDASRKYDRAVRAGAVALGCRAEIITTPGYLPVHPLQDTHWMEQVLEDLSIEAKAHGHDYSVGYRRQDFHEAGSTDSGELSSLLPVYQFRTGGYKGALHNADICVTNEQLAYVEAAKAFALLSYRLMKDRAQGAKETIEHFTPAITKEQYFAYMKEMNTVVSIR